ncbi:U2 small nuclear RNA auxiliary factor 2 [Actinomortierella ambigua]|nr:U2 small nuclear RNA auxiliary factor 2 [Actinomortierella ambigua]
MESALSGRASELADSFFSELKEELNPMARAKQDHGREDSERDRHRSSSSRYDRDRSERHKSSDRDRERDRDRGDRERPDRERERDRERRSDRDRSERRDRGERSERGERDRDRDRDRGDRGDRSDRDRSGRDRDYDRYERDRHHDREQDRSRDRRHREDRYREGSARESSGREGSSRRHSRSRSPRGGGGGGREFSPMVDVVPIDKRPRKLNNWDVPPAGYEDKTCAEVKALGIFPPPGQPAVLRSEILQGMDPARAAQLVHELPPRPLRTNYPPIGPNNINHYSSIVQSLQGHHGPGHRGGGGGGGSGGSGGAGVGGGPNQNNQDGAGNTVSRQSKRLYCGNIPLGIDEGSLANFFNQTMMSMSLTTGAGAPVVSVQINHDKNYAFVEFRTPEEATAAMAFDGIVFQGQTLKIRRPKDYQPPPGQTGNEVPQIHVPGVISTNVPDSEHKIFIGGLPLYLNDEQVIELLQAFGELKAFNLVKENNVGASKGFAFCEYLDPNITDIACQGLNNMQLGEKKLVVQRASVGSNRQNQQNNSGGGGGGGGGGGHYNNSNHFNNQFTGANAIQLHPNLLLASNGGSAEVVATTVLQLLNMVTPDELLDDEEYQDIVDDIRDECSKFGQIADIQVPRPDPQGHPVPGVGKIFVRYTAVDEAMVAARALSGRKFADRTVLTSFVDEQKFDERDF